MPANTNHKSTELIILMSDKIDFKTRNIIDKEGYFIMPSETYKNNECIHT